MDKEISVVTKEKMIENCAEIMDIEKHIANKAGMTKQIQWYEKNDLKRLLFVGEWNPLLNVKHFFMVIDKVNVEFRRNSTQQNNRYSTSYFDGNSWAVRAKDLKELMPLTIKAITKEMK